MSIVRVFYFGQSYVSLNVLLVSERARRWSGSTKDGKSEVDDEDESNEVSEVDGTPLKENVDPRIKVCP